MDPNNKQLLNDSSSSRGQNLEPSVQTKAIPPQPLAEQTPGPNIPSAGTKSLSPVPASVSNPALGAVSSNPEAVVSSATVRVNSIVHKMTRPTWLIVLLSIVGCIIIIAVIIAIPALQKNSWANANNAKLNTIIGNFNVDNNAANTAVSIGNSNGLRIACIELGAGADKLQALPAYPISKTQTELDIAIAEIKQGSSECSQAISQKNSTALVKASKEIQAGMSSLSKAVTAIGATGTTSS